MNRSLKSVILIVLIGGLLLLVPNVAKPQSSPELQIVHQLKSGPGNITMTPDGRTIISLHQFFNPRMRVAQMTTDGQLVPFPNSNILPQGVSRPHP